jgi:hypothetical protein
MTEVLGKMITAIKATLTSLWAYLAAVFTNPASRNIVFWIALVFMLGLIGLILWRSLRRPKTSPFPELLVSKGEIAQQENSLKQVLVLKVSNLNAYPVQLLELTLKTELMTAPIMIEAVELLGPQESVELEATLPHNIAGDNGILSVFSYITRSKRLYRLRAQFEWEPWASRYKISPLGQVIQLAKKLESAQFQELRKRAWHERHSRRTAQDFLEKSGSQGSNQEPKSERETIHTYTPSPKVLVEDAPNTNAPLTSNLSSKRQKLDMDFPSEF